MLPGMTAQNNFTKTCFVKSDRDFLIRKVLDSINQEVTGNGKNKECEYRL